MRRPTFSALVFFTVLAGLAEAGPPGSFAVDFDGVDDHLVVNNAALQALHNSGEITYEMWVYKESANAAGSLLHRGATSLCEYEPIVENSGGPSTVVRLSGCSATGFITSFVLAVGWSHVAVAASQTGDFVNVYVNGMLVGSQAVSVITAASNQPGRIFNSSDPSVYFGRTHISGGTSFGPAFDGVMTEIRIWDHAREQAAIQADMNIQLLGTEPGLVAYWKLDEGSGSTMTDSAGSHTGQLGSTAGADANDPAWVSLPIPVELMRFEIE